MALKIRTATVADAVAIQRIYAPIVSTTAISFEEIPPSAEEIAQRIATTLQTYPYLVAEEGVRSRDMHTQASIVHVQPTDGLLT